MHEPRRWQPSATSFILCLTICWSAAGSPRELAGKELADALLGLEAEGLSIVFTSELVKPGMRIAREPASAGARARLDEILAPFSLRAQETAGGILVIVPAGGPAATECCTVTGRVRDRETLAPLAEAIVRVDGNARTMVTDELGRFVATSIPAGRRSVVATARGFVDESVDGVGVSPEAPRHLELLLSPAPFLQEKIEVFGGSGASTREPLATPCTLSHDELERVPQLGDPMRGLSFAPGTASNDLSARISVRGGRPDETKVVLDGQEIYDPWHLKDYESALTIIPSIGLSNASLLSGGLSSAPGDRMGGAVDLRTRGRESARSMRSPRARARSHPNEGAGSYRPAVASSTLPPK